MGGASAFDALILKGVFLACRRKKASVCLDASTLDVCAVLYCTFSFEYMDSSSGSSLVSLVNLVVFDSVQKQETKTFNREK